MDLQELSSNVDDTTIDTESGYVDLAPITNADSDGCYSTAIQFALDNPQVNNIALTGPYGSGKSSIIKTFVSNNQGKYRFLNISLASFKEEPNLEVNDAQSRLIERSILQQMLYGADANKLPYSRFRRISTPEFPLTKAFLFAIWLVSVYSLFQFKVDLLSFDQYSLSWWSLIMVLAFASAMPVMIFSDLYKASFKISLKKISLTNAEIETGDIAEDSILNRHLDEIIYFFQVCRYDVVIIEDLDRFGDPEIFVKLREINKLLNENLKASGNIKFMYALKDDMFIHKSRAKFFDFIIPVVPVINSFNSLDMMKRRLDGLPFRTNISFQFLREVSLYIDDLRLMHNTYNEFIIYHEKIKSEKLDPTKLLAMMIYKNMYPADFERLHHSSGALFEICRKRTSYFQEAKSALNKNLAYYEKQLELCERENVDSVQELIDLYMGYIIRNSHGAQVSGIYIGGSVVYFNQISSFEIFEPIISDSNITLHNPSYPYRHALNKSFSQIEDEINSSYKFLERKKRVEYKNINERKRIYSEIDKIKSELASLPQNRLEKVIQDINLNFDDVLNENKILNGGLLIYLVRNGYLDDTYHLYISNFHEGRLTKNDRDYLLTVRNFSQPSPNQSIDTPAEVCASLREEDFSQAYILNVVLIDYLFDFESENRDKIRRIIKYVSENYDNTVTFFNAYLLQGKRIGEYIRCLSDFWPELISSALLYKNASEVVACILRYVDATYIAEKMNESNELTDYLAVHGYTIFTSTLPQPEDYTAINLLKVKFKSLPLLAENKKLLEYSYNMSLYSISSENITFLLRQHLGLSEVDVNRSNYTVISSLGEEPLKKYIESNLSDYILNVFLKIPSNSEESIDSIKRILSRDDVMHSVKEAVITKQNFALQEFKSVPEIYWPQIMREEKISFSWSAISEYLNHDKYEKKYVTEALNKTYIVDILSKTKISTCNLEQAETSKLCRFVIDNDQIKIEMYKKLVNCLAYYYYDFPENLSEDKINYLAANRIVRLTKDSFNSCDDNNNLIALLIEKNISEYFENKEEYPIEDSVRKLLLQSQLNNVEKIKILYSFASPKQLEDKKFAAIVASLLATTDFDCAQIEATNVSLAIVSAGNMEESIQILIKCFKKWRLEFIFDIFSQLPEPYRSIPIYGRRPKLANTQTNIKLSELLLEYKYISSFRRDVDHIRLITWKTGPESLKN